MQGEVRLYSIAKKPSGRDGMRRRWFAPNRPSSGDARPTFDPRIAVAVEGVGRLSVTGARVATREYRPERSTETDFDR